MENNIFKIALSLLPGIGPRLTRNLVSYVGSIEGIFSEKKSILEKVPGIGKTRLAALNFTDILKRAESKLKILQNDNINWFFYLDDGYPARLKECEDGPIVLYYRGENCFDGQKTLSIVGTRDATNYGEENCKKLINELAAVFPDLVIVSGFAYGIDIIAHKAALNAGLKTIAVFGTGIEIIYPSLHKKYLKSVIEHGSICSEFHNLKSADPGNFVSRNRIIAGLSDATVVVESGEKGGSLLTADMANSYNRDVFAFPGRIGDIHSQGCNNLIKNNQAVLLETAGDLIMHMRWDTSIQNIPVQTSLFEEVSPEESKVVNILKTNSVLTLDELARTLSQPVSKVSANLLNLEFKGLVKALPGKSFRLNV